MSEQMKPGRELDALVAEKVMGWKHCRIKKPGEWSQEEHGLEPGEALGFSPVAAGVRIVPHYSANIDAAWQLVEELKLADYAVSLHHHPDQVSAWSAEVYRPEWDEGCGISTFEDTAPHAICLAALAAVKGGEG